MRKFQSGFGVDEHPGLSITKTPRSSPARKQIGKARKYFMRTRCHKSAGLSWSVSRHPDTGTDQIAVAVNIIYATHRGPELVVVKPLGWKTGLLARVRVVPLLLGQHISCVRRVF